MTDVALPVCCRMLALFSKEVCLLLTGQMHPALSSASEVLACSWGRAADTGHCEAAGHLLPRSAAGANESA